MATTPLRLDIRPASAPRELGMKVYWVVVTLISVALLGAAIGVATPRDAAETLEAQASSQ